MASEILAVPEEHLSSVIAVIRAGLLMLDELLKDEVKAQLIQWCDEEEAYLRVESWHESS